MFHILHQECQQRSYAIADLEKRLAATGRHLAVALAEVQQEAETIADLQNRLQAAKAEGHKRALTISDMHKSLAASEIEALAARSESQHHATANADLRTLLTASESELAVALADAIAEIERHGFATTDLLNAVVHVLDEFFAAPQQADRIVKSFGSIVIQAG